MENVTECKGLFRRVTSVLFVFLMLMLYCTPSKANSPLKVFGAADISAEVIDDLAAVAWRQWYAARRAFTGMVVVRLRDYQIQGVAQTRLQDAAALSGLVRYQAQLEAELWREEQLVWRRVRQVQLREAHQDRRTAYLNPNLLSASFQLPQGLFTRFMTDEHYNRRLLFLKGINKLYSDLQQFLKDDPLQERINFGG